MKMSIRVGESKQKVNVSPSLFVCITGHKQNEMNNSTIQTAWPETSHFLATLSYSNETRVQASDTGCWCG